MSSDHVDAKEGAGKQKMTQPRPFKQKSSQAKQEGTEIALKTCRFFVQNGRCKNGSTCTFLHDPNMVLQAKEARTKEQQISGLGAKEDSVDTPSKSGPPAGQRSLLASKLLLSAIKPKATDASSNGSGTEAEPAAVQVKSGPPALPSPVMKASGPPPGFGPPAVSGPPGFGPPHAAPAAAAGPVASAAAVQQQVAEEEAPIKLELNLEHILPSEQHSIGFFPTASPDKMSLPRPPQVPVDDNSSLTLPMMLPLSRDGLLSHQPVQQPQHNLGNSRLHQQQQQQHGQQQQQHGAIGSPLQLSGQPPSIAGYRDPWGISLGHHHPAAAMSSPSLWGNNSGFGEGSGGGGGGGGPPSFSQWREEIMLAPPVTPVNPAHIPHHQQQGVNADFLASAMMSALSTGEAVRPSPPPGMTRPAVNAAAVSAVQPAPATDKQKTAAMMSLLKSKAGDQFMSAAPRKSSPDSQAVSAAPNLAPVAANAVHGSSAIQEAMQKDASDATSAAAVVAALEETVAASMPAAFVKRPPPLTRTVKNQRCQLIIKVRNFRSGEQEVLPVGYYFRPGNGMTVEYRLPIDLFESLYAGRSKTDSATVPIAVGLFRYGSQANNAPIVAKNITFTPPYTRIEDRHTKQVYVVSSMQFFAPRAPGQFIYRLYNNETRESSMETMATSTMFSVVLVEQDIISSLQHVKEAFDEAGIPPSNGNRMRTGSDLGTGTATANPTSNSLINKAIAQLGQAIRGIKACSVVTREVSPLLSRCVERVLDEVNASLMILEEGQEKKRLLKLTQQLTLEGESKLPLEGEDKILLVGDKIPLPGDIVEEINETVEQAEFWRSYRNAHKLQQDCYDTLSILIDKKTAWYLITEKLKNTIRFLLGLYCPVLRRFARSQHELQKLRIEVLFFVPASDPKTQNPNPNFQILPSQTQMFLDQAIRFLLPSLLPDNHFYEKREQTRIMIERQLLDSGAMPVGSTLAVYGSSGNGFGSSASDLDMCLLLPAAVVSTAASITATSTTAAAAASSASTATQQAQQQAQQAQQQQEERIHHLEQISLALASSGFDHISTRLTARVPIIEFFDPLSNLDCDISLHNALALANTKLLRSYSDCDPRVKILAALIKYWARRRHLNSPADGTLSSYGYVLSLIFFLQNRPVPMLLNLQRLPPNWRGEKVDNKSSSSGGTGVPKTMEKNMSNDQLCDVYCLQPNPKQMELLQSIAAQNTESIPTLLIEYYRFYLYDFDMRSDVVTIRRPFRDILKVDKYEEVAWLHGDSWAIEDPFETSYDVGHVLRAAQMAYLRREMFRAYTVMARTVPPQPPQQLQQVDDALPAFVQPTDCIELLCANCDPPSFVGKRLRAMSMSQQKGKEREQAVVSAGVGEEDA